MFYGIHRQHLPPILPALLIVFTAAAASAPAYQQVVDGVAVYFGIVPAQLVRGHPRQHPEREMHSGPRAGESHIMVALFDDKTGKRLENVAVYARVTGDRGLNVEKPLEPMAIAGSLTYGNYFSLTGTGPYRIRVRFRRPDSTNDIHAEFTWVRS